ncbi:MAG: FAD:protein FMN transferase [Candidatus Omnitrophica bacterium]|nr:FAD:protein FMN transferase [Candidatus Omnitrophota bacterium]
MRRVRRVTFLIGMCAVLFIGGCVAPRIYSDEQVLMGTTAAITVVPDTVSARAAVREAFRIFRRYEQRFNFYDHASELSQLNRQAVSENFPVSEELWQMLNRALAYCRDTNGAFDITATSLGCRDGYRTIVCDPLRRTVRFSRPGTKIDLGGIVAGAAIDAAVPILKKNGVKNFLIDIGGDMYAAGCNQWNRPWQIGVRNPLRQQEVIAVLPVRNKAVTTSGNYVKNHLISTLPQAAAERVLSMTVAAAAAAEADVLATAFYVMGVERARDYLRRHAGIEAIAVVLRRGELSVDYLP